MVSYFNWWLPSILQLFVLILGVQDLTSGSPFKLTFDISIILQHFLTCQSKIFRVCIFPNPALESAMSKSSLVPFNGRYLEIKISVLGVLVFYMLLIPDPLSGRNQGVCVFVCICVSIYLSTYLCTYLLTYESMYLYIQEFIPILPILIQHYRFYLVFLPIFVIPCPTFQM